MCGRHERSAPTATCHQGAPGPGSRMREVWPPRPKGALVAAGSSTRVAAHDEAYS